MSGSQFGLRWSHQQRKTWGLTVVMAVVLSLFGAGPASAVSTAHVHGVATDDLGAALSGVDVYVSGPEYKSMQTDGAGGYAFDVVPGEYEVCAYKVGYAQTCDYRNLTSGSDVTVNLAMERLGHITGTATGAGFGPVGSVQVTALEQYGTRWYRSYTTETLPDGTYDLPVFSGTYRLRFVDFGGRGLFTTYFGGTRSVDTATSVTTTPGQSVTGKNVAMAQSAGISGTVNRPVGSVGSQDRQVRVVDLTNGDVVGKATIDRHTGAYQVWGLEGGSYRVSFNRVSGWAFAAAEFYDGKAEPQVASANAVPVVAATNHVGVDATLVAGGTISGTLVDTTGAPLRYCQLQAFTTAAPELVTRSTYSTAGGAFSIGGLSTGDYYLRVVRGGHCDGRYSVYDGDDVLGTDHTIKTLVHATLGGDAPVGTLHYQRGGSIGGSVTSAAPRHGTDRVVLAVNSATNRVVGKDFIGSGGHYKIKGLLPGSYRLAFSRVSGMAEAAPAFYDNKTETARQQASLVSLATGEDRTGVDGSLVTGRTMSGQVVDSDGASLPNCYVQAFRRSHFLVTRTAYTGTDGTFTIGGLSAGRYRLRVLWCGQTGYYDGDSNLGSRTSAVLVSTRSGPTVSLGTLTLDDLGNQVTNSSTPTISGTPVVGSVLTASPGSWQPSGLTYTYRWAADGAFIGAATAATYTATAGDVGKHLSVVVTARRTGWSDGVASSAQTAPVTAPAPPPPPPAQPPTLVNTAVPTIGGTAAVGKIVTAGGGAWAPGDVGLGYQWLSDGAPIAGATATTFAIPAALKGHTLAVRVTADRAGSAPSAATSAGSTVASGTLSLAAPKVSGKAKVGSKLKVALGAVAPAATQVHYKWMRNGKAIKKATKSAYALISADRGKQISVKVTYSAPGYATVVKVVKLSGKVK